MGVVTSLIKEHSHFYGLIVYVQTEGDPVMKCFLWFLG